MDRFLFLIFFIGLIILNQSCHLSHTSLEKVPQLKAELPDDQKEKWRLMVGKWYGSQPLEQGGKKEWVITREENGFYEVSFRNQLRDGTIEERIEVGDWGIAESFYFSIFQGWIIEEQFVPADRNDPYNRDVYKVIRLTDQLFEYQNISTKERYTVKRVNSDFTLP